jgi:tripartite-type tricarboxylate transporter receptor subunit TctC
MRCRILAGTLALLAALGSPGSADQYPSRTVRLVVPYAAGGAVDVVARLLAPGLAAQLGVPVIVENRVGAAGAVGAGAVAKSEPDGYTLLFTANSTHTTVPHISKSTPYDPIVDFTPIATVLDYSFFLVVNPGVPVHSVAELVAYARKNTSAVNYSSAGIGSGPHLAAELLKSATGAPMVHIPYSGNGPAMTAVISGEVTFLFDTTGTAIGQIRAGQVRPLAVTSATRNRMLSDLPTMIEAGVPGFEVVGWYGFMGPAALPEPVATRFIRALEVVMADATVQERLLAQGFDVKLTTLGAFAARVKSDYALWGRVVSEAKIGAR